MFRLSGLASALEHMADFQTFSCAIVEDVVMPAKPLPDMSDATLIRCDLTAASMPEDLGNALFVDCRMSGLSFKGANIFNTRFIRCDLSGCRFVGCDLSAAQFEDCRLDDEAFQDSDIDTIEIIRSGATIAA
ncbi:pentapeptide repeat-containing protein [Telmatospirillum siberiense]|uniref:Pentapeptide repeat-containing protein n=1 Tax=Telmatospirillum siberiense TaxID=382514 RepID=A0A2N3PUV1_9PROT|nr:pentapeptide repeat-containing protein [Telmatospirillum siberiense]PKU24176.1 hypothetical protein CWS72_12635 [Telmatospirillum siberiense]